MSEEPVLRPEEVASVLSGDGSSPSAEPGSDEPQPYSLREPVAIPASAEPVARGKLERVAAALAKRFDAEAEDGIKVALEGFQQQRAKAALSVLPGPVWVASLGAAGGGGLALALQPAVAIALMDKALGGRGIPPENGREPTDLEARVVTRIIGAAAGEIGEILGTSLAPVDLVLDQLPARIAASGETVGVSSLRFTIGEVDHASLLLASASLLVPSAPNAKPSSKPPGPLAPRLEHVTFEARPVLPAGRVATADLAELELGKVLQFGVDKNQLMELRVGKTLIAHGYVRREDEQAIFLVESRVGRAPAKEES